MARGFRTELQVRYSEIDGQSVVFNSRYLEYADVAISDYWRAAAIAGFETHVVKATVEFVKPLRYRDTVAMLARTLRVGTTSITTTIEMVHAETKALHARVELVHVHVDLASGRPLAVPAEIRERLAAFDAAAIPPP